MAAALKYEPTVRVDFSHADLPNIAAAMAVLIEREINTRERIEAYLINRGCRHASDTLTYLLNSLEGGDGRHCLWTRSKTGTYSNLHRYHF